MLSRSVTWLLFLSLPLMALARRFPNGATDKFPASQVSLKISVSHPRDDFGSSYWRDDRVLQAFRLPQLNKSAERGHVGDGDVRRKLVGVPRLVGGVGSSPPKCIGRCGMCSPCLPVNVPIGGAKTDNEYYPEVWRCKCNDKLFIP